LPLDKLAPMTGRKEAFRKTVSVKRLTGGIGAPTPGATVTVTDARGFTGRWSALTVAVSRTEVALDVAGTAICACIWRVRAPALTWPSWHAAVRLWLPQPKSNEAC